MSAFIFQFEGLKQLYQILSHEEKMKPVLPLGPTSCLAMILKSDDMDEVSFLVDLLSTIKVESKHLFVEMNTVFDANLILNKTINFDITISDTDRQFEGNECLTRSGP